MFIRGKTERRAGAKTQEQSALVLLSHTNIPALWNISLCTGRAWFRSAGSSFISEFHPARGASAQHTYLTLIRALPEPQLWWGHLSVQKHCRAVWQDLPVIQNPRVQQPAALTLMGQELLEIRAGQQHWVPGGISPGDSVCTEIEKRLPCLI